MEQTVTLESYHSNFIVTVVTKEVTIVTRVTRMARRSYLRLSTLDLSMGRDKRGDLDRLSLAGKEKSALALLEACEQSQPWDLQPGL